MKTNTEAANTCNPTNKNVWQYLERRNVKRCIDCDATFCREEIACIPTNDKVWRYSEQRNVKRCIDCGAKSLPKCTTR
jgi:hypothetical protein